MDPQPKASPAIDRLMASAKLSETTKKNYFMRVKQYLRDAEMTPDELVKHVKAHPRKFEESFISFLQGVSKRSSSSTTMSFRDSVKRFLDINRVETVNWSYINEFVPSTKKAGQDRAPTSDEIRRMIDVSDLRMKCLVLFLCSSGARIGSVPFLKWRDVEEVEVEGRKFARVAIYRGEPEEYVTFVTPECWRHWQEYKRWRENIGEKVTPTTHVFVTQGNATTFDPNGVRPASVKTLKNLLGRMLENLKMRTAIAERGAYRNYEFKQAHGFRKFFKTRMEVVGVKPLAIETMMGHSTGVSKSYYKPTIEELAGEYAKAIKELTITGEKQPGAEETVVTIRKELLRARHYSEEEIAQLGDLAQMGAEQFVQALDRKANGVNGNSSQKVVSAAELKGMIERGWEYVTQLPDGNAIVRLPVLSPDLLQKQPVEYLKFG